ncbi:MAG: hypothetical protein N2449_10395, partial [Bacteroidales bacterium]|nr:hypothetical protein [Bacteroidales bacterium]
MMRIIFLILILFNISGFSQISLNLTGTAPDASAAWDIQFSDKGILIPRVSLTQTTSASPITSPANSLLVYNTATQNDVTPGYYYWNGSRWIRILGSDKAWMLDGNAGTNASTNFLGTTDAVDLVFRTNNVEHVRVTSGGLVGIGINNPSHKLTVQSSTISTLRLIGPGSYGSTARLNFGDANYVYMEEDADDYLTIYARLRTAIMGGNVGINTTTPANKLGIIGSLGWGASSEVNALNTDQGGSIELGGTNSIANPVSNGVPYIDFHYGIGTAQDYNTRIINDANGRLNLIGTIRINNAYSLPTTTPSDNKILIASGGNLVWGEVGWVKITQITLTNATYYQLSGLNGNVDNC